MEHIGARSHKNQRLARIVRYFLYTLGRGRDFFVAGGADGGAIFWVG